MTTAFPTALLALLSGAGASTAPGEQNVIPLWPTTAGGVSETAPTTVIKAASPARAVLRAATRAYVLIGEEATVRGIAAQFRKLLFPAAMTVPATVRNCTDAVLAAALYRVATEVAFGAARPLSVAEADSHWTVGTLFPLPVWAVDAGGTRTWNVDVDRVATAVGAVSALAATDPGATLPARLLHQADASASATEVTGAARFATAFRRRADLQTALTAAAPTYPAATEGARLAAEARWNPYAVLFALLELSIVVDRAKPDVAAPFAEAFWDELTEPERKIMARTSAGHVWLRRLWTWWGRTAVNVDLRTTLGLTDDDLTARAPGTFGDLEPPLLGRQAPHARRPPLPTASPATKKTDMSIVAFGRRVPFVGVDYPLDKPPTFFGISTSGAVPTRGYLLPPAGDPTARPIDPALVPGADPAEKARTQAQWSRVLTAIGAAEGQLDAASAWDSGICSLGFQQLSMHIPNQGPVLLERLKNVGPVYYDAVVRALGLETGRDDDPQQKPSSGGAAVGDLDADVCFFTLTAQGRTRYPATKQGVSVTPLRRDVFEWTTNGTFWFVGRRAMLLAARWSVAARYAPELWQAATEIGFTQVRRAAAQPRTKAETNLWAPVLALPGIPQPAPPRTATVLEMFGTEALMALVVDMIVNTTSHLGAAMRRAVVRAVAVAHQDGLAAQPPALDDRFFLLLAQAFVTERYYYGKKGGKKKDKNRPVLTARAGSIDVAPERVRTLLNVLGTLRDLPKVDTPAQPARPVDPAVAALLAEYRIPRDDAVSLTARVLWP